MYGNLPTTGFSALIYAVVGGTMVVSGAVMRWIGRK